MTCAAKTGGWYPWVICHAVALVDDLPVFRALPDSYGAVLRRLIKKVGKDDGQRAICARRQTLADETGKSVETIYRALREFETKGWIEERERRAGVGLKGSDSEITFTKALCDLLELPYEGKQVKSKSRPPVTKDSSYKAIVISSLQPSLKEQPAESSKLSTSNAGDGPVVRIEGKSVPQELAWLVLENGLSLSGLFALMKQARKHGKLLSDIVESVGKYLVNLEGRNLFAYLNKLAVLERDFAWEMRQKRAEHNVQKRRIEEAQRLEKAATTLHGRWFFSKKTGAVYEVNRNYMTMFFFDESGRVRSGSDVLETAFLDAVEAGILVPCAAGATPVRVEHDGD